MCHVHFIYQYFQVNHIFLYCPFSRIEKIKNFHISEEARQNVHLVLRVGGSHEVTEALPHCGTRVTKVFFLAHPLADPKTQHILWWAPFGPDRAMNLRDTHATLTSLVQCQVS